MAESKGVSSIKYLRWVKSELGTQKCDRKKLLSNLKPALDSLDLLCFTIEIERARKTGEVVGGARLRFAITVK